MDTMNVHIDIINKWDTGGGAGVKLSINSTHEVEEVEEEEADEGSNSNNNNREKMKTSPNHKNTI